MALSKSEKIVTLYSENAHPWHKQINIRYSQLLFSVISVVPASYHHPLHHRGTSVLSPFFHSSTPRPPGPPTPIPPPTPGLAREFSGCLSRFWRRIHLQRPVQREGGGTRLHLHHHHGFPTRSLCMSTAWMNRRLEHSWRSSRLSCAIKFFIRTPEPTKHSIPPGIRCICEG